MTSLSAHVAAAGLLRIGDSGHDVAAMQSALAAAGYRTGHDGEFDAATDVVVRKFQVAHGLAPDGIVGPITAALLDAPHAVLVATAKPASIVAAAGTWPHDDTASLVAFYGNPAVNNGVWQAKNLVPVTPPWQMFGGDADDGKSPVKNIYFHRLAAPALLAALEDVWSHYGRDETAIRATGMHRFSGAYNFRPIRGSSRLSEHAFAAAIDFDSQHEAMNHEHRSNMAAPVIDAFKARGAFWGGDYRTRQDPMHFGWAHE